MRDDFEPKDEEVGFKKPPKSGQFKKGVSGNPSGRPKKASDIGSELMREAQAPLTINENGQRKVIRKYQGVAKQLMNKALTGNLPAARLLIDLLKQALDKAGEEQRNAPFNLSLVDLSKIDVRDLTDDQLFALIQADVEQAIRDKIEKSVEAKLRKSIRAELESSTSSGANGH